MDWWWVLVVAIRSVSPEPGDQWATRLTELDQTRAVAFASADPGRLDAVYLPSSRGLRDDAATIEAYANRDGRVVGAELRVLSCHVVRSAEDRVSLDVIDQLAPSHVVWGDGSTTLLPDDRPSRRLVTVVRTGDGWRISETRLSGQG